MREVVITSAARTKIDTRFPFHGKRKRGLKLPAPVSRHATADRHSRGTSWARSGHGLLSDWVIQSLNP